MLIEGGNPKHIATIYVNILWSTPNGINGSKYPKIKLCDFSGVVYNLSKNALSLSLAINVDENNVKKDSIDSAYHRRS